MENIGGNIFVGLISAGFVVILTKIGEFLLAGRTHSLELKKIYLGNKLAASEKIVSGLNTMIGSLYNMQLAFAHLANSNGELTGAQDDLVDSLVNRSDEQMKQLMNSSNSIINVIPLYFDMDDLNKELIDQVNKFYTFLPLIEQLSDDEDEQDLIKVAQNHLTAIEQVVLEMIQHIRMFAKKIEG